MLENALAPLFYLAVAAYLGAAALSLRYLRGADIRVLFYAKRVAAIGNVFLLLVFLLRWWEHRQTPLTNAGDSISLFLILCTGIMLTVQRREAMRPLLCFYLPALAILALVAAFVAPPYLKEPPNQELNDALLTAHVGMVFLAFALFFVASLTSMAYAFQAQHLKRHKTIGLFQRLPSLEQLDRTLYRLISVGYPLFVVTLIFGLGWAWADRELLGPYWFFSPKILLSILMVTFYAVSFHIRRIGLLRGPKLAYLVFFGFSSLLAAYLVLGLLKLGTYNFWETAA